MFRAPRRNVMTAAFRKFFAALLAVRLLGSMAAAQDAAAVAARQAFDVYDRGDYASAANALGNFVRDYPTSQFIFQARLELGSALFSVGKFDAADAELKQLLAPPAPADVQEAASALVGQVAAARATALPLDDPQRKAGFENAVAAFTRHLEKFPKSDGTEAALYGRALANYQLAHFDDAAKDLRTNLASFPRSESILDSQYLLAITLATQASELSRDPKAAANPAPALALFGEAEKLLRDIVTRKTDVALANDATFQLGEVLANRAALAPENERAKLLSEALEAYRATDARERMIAAQNVRIAAFQNRLREALRANDGPLIKRLRTLLNREQTKLGQLQAKPDQTLAAQVKSAQIYFQQQRYDEARVLLRTVQPFAETPEQRKPVLYFLAMTYALQGIADKAVATYDEFESSFAKDPLADNLPLAIGNLFLQKDPARALQYFQKQQEQYPNGRVAAVTTLQQASALMALNRFDEALKIFQSFLAGNPPKEAAAQAELALANIYASTKRWSEALAGFRKVRDTYAGLPQADEAAFRVGWVTLQKGDAAGAIKELNDFIKKNPLSANIPVAFFTLAQAQLAAGQKDAALASFRTVGEQFPKAEVATYSYFQRAQILAAVGRRDEMIQVLREFIAKYPADSKLYFAYDTIAETFANEKNTDEAASAYDEFLQKFPANPEAPTALLKLAELWRKSAEALGRYLALNEAQRGLWTKSVNTSIETAERLVQSYPESPQSAPALQTLLSDQRLLIDAKIKTSPQLEDYFQGLARKWAANRALQSKILFTLAGYLYEIDKPRARALMASAYDPSVTYVPSDFDLYAEALFADHKLDEAQQVYAKLENDYGIPAGVSPAQAPRITQEAQAIVLFGKGKIAELQGRTNEAAGSYNQLAALYSWSPKLMEARIGIARSLREQKKYDEAMKTLGEVVRAPSATAEQRARAMLESGATQLAKGDMDSAIDYYIKISVFYPGVPSAAAEGLWQGAQLLEKKAAVEKARGYYRQLVEKYPASPYADRAKERLSTTVVPAKA